VQLHASLDAVDVRVKVIWAERAKTKNAGSLAGISRLHR
jgi:lambda repressor-like predicted transcriptional regulator